MTSHLKNNVKKNDVGKVVQSYIDDGAKKVFAEKNSDGSWNVTAEFPN